MKIEKFEDTLKSKRLKDVDILSNEKRSNRVFSNYLSNEENKNKIAAKINEAQIDILAEGLEKNEEANSILNSLKKIAMDTDTKNVKVNIETLKKLEAILKASKNIPVANKAAIKEAIRLTEKEEKKYIETDPYEEVHKAKAFTEADYVGGKKYREARKEGKGQIASLGSGLKSGFKESIGIDPKEKLTMKNVASGIIPGAMHALGIITKSPGLNMIASKLSERRKAGIEAKKKIDQDQAEIKDKIDEDILSAKIEARAGLDKKKTTITEDREDTKNIEDVEEPIVKAKKIAVPTKVPAIEKAKTMEAKADEIGDEEKLETQSEVIVASINKANKDICKTIIGSTPKTKTPGATAEKPGKVDKTIKESIAETKVEAIPKKSLMSKLGGIKDKILPGASKAVGTIGKGASAVGKILKSPAVLGSIAAAVGGVLAGTGINDLITKLNGGKSLGESAFDAVESMTNTAAMDYEPGEPPEKTKTPAMAPIELKKSIEIGKKDLVLPDKETINEKNIKSEGINTKAVENQLKTTTIDQVKEDSKKKFEISPTKTIAKSEGESKRKMEEAAVKPIIINTPSKGKTDQGSLPREKMPAPFVTSGDSNMMTLLYSSYMVGAQ